MARYFNMIRYRVGLPGVEAATLSSENAFDEVIKNERQVELFNEGHRYFDTRRWGTYFTEDANSSNWRGLAVNIETTPVRTVSILCEVSTPTTCVEVAVTFIEELNLTLVLDNLIESIL